MDDGDFDFPGKQMLSCMDMPIAQSSCSFDIDEFLDDALGRTQACTHAHACNPSGPDKSHTHTCIHVHTQIMPSPNDPSDDTAESVDRTSKKRSSGNREAVRKYREKKKARAASLEDEVVRLRALNQQLMKRLQGQALLEAEIARLKCLLVDVRGRIEGEIGAYPYQKPNKSDEFYQDMGNSNPNIPGGYGMNACNVSCTDQLYCHGGQGVGDCGFDNLQCLGDQYSDPKGIAGNVNVVSSGYTSNGKRKGTRAAMAS